MGPARSFTTLDEVLTGWARSDPDAVALLTESGAWRAADLARLVAAQAEAIRRATPPGARVAVHAATSAEVVAVLYAVPAAGRTLVPLNTRGTPAELVDQLDRARVALVLGDPVPGHAGPTRPVTDLADAGAAGAAMPDAADPAAGSPPDPGAVAWLLFTSGSTGRPKGVCLTHASLAAAVATTAAARPLADDEVYLYPFPLFHVAAYNVVHAHLRRRPVVLPDRFDARRIVELCHDHGVTAMSVAATMLRLILDALASEPDLAPPPSLRTVAYGAAPMPEGLLREAHRLLGVDFAQGYGSTELSGNAVFLGPAEHRRGLAGEARLLGTAGRPGPGVAVRTVDDAGDDVPPGTPGELLVSAAQVCAGYLDDEAATAATIVDGWLHTGDIAVIDTDGLVTIVDRAKDLVVTGGENVASREVEDALRDLPGVADVAVVGTPHDRWGEAVTAVLVLDATGDGSTPPAAVGSEPVVPLDPVVVDRLDADLRDRLAGYKRPRRWFGASALPRNANGKVDKPALRRALARFTPSPP